MKTRKGKLALALVFFPLFFLIASCSLGTASITTTRKALLIGIKDYLGTANDNLKYTVADAESTQALLGAQGWDTEILTDSQATKIGIQTAIHDFLGNVPANGTALIYYSGHGTLSNLQAAIYQENHGTLSAYGGDIGEALLVPYDFDTKSWTGGISASDLSTWFEADLLTKNVIVIADSCFSGGFVPTSDSVDTIGQEYAVDSGGSVYSSSLAALGSFGDLLAANAAAKGTLSPVVISAAGSRESSYDGTPSQGHGVFTYYLLESATKGDANGDGYVTCTEAYTYAAKAVNRAWTIRSAAVWYSIPISRAFARPGPFQAVRNTLMELGSRD